MFDRRQGAYIGGFYDVFTNFLKKNLVDVALAIFWEGRGWGNFLLYLKP